MMATCLSRKSWKQLTRSKKEKKIFNLGTRCQHNMTVDVTLRFAKNISIWGSFQYWSNLNTCETSLKNVLSSTFGIFHKYLDKKDNSSPLDRQFRVRLSIILTIPFLPSHIFVRTKYIILLAVPLLAFSPFWVWIFCMTEFTSKLWKIKVFSLFNRCVWYGITQMIYVFIMGAWLIQGHAGNRLP